MTRLADADGELEHHVDGRAAAGTRVNRAAVVGEALDRLGLLQLALAARRRGLWPRAGLTVVTYHRVVDSADVGDLDPDLIDATPDEFDAQMAYLRKNFHPVSIEEVLAAHHGGPKLRPDSVLVTFDDGYLDNYEHALPVLKRHDIKALFFVATGYISDRRLFWWERVGLTVRRSTRAQAHLDYPQAEELDLSSPAAKKKAIRRLNRIIKDQYGLDLERFLDGVASACGVTWDPEEGRALGDRSLMTWDHVRGLRAAGMGVGSHTHSHRILLTLLPGELPMELAGSRAALEERLGEPVTTIAYPAGKSITAVVPVRQAVADAGYELGFSTAPGMNLLSRGEDPLDLRRVVADRSVPTGLARTWLTFPFLAQ
jgi:peptidoglycan/xylan/chitin deacetylase (PgdA/CDA1 family)